MRFDRNKKFAVHENVSTAPQYIQLTSLDIDFEQNRFGAALYEAFKILIICGLRGADKDRLMGNMLLARLWNQGYVAPE